MCFSFFVGVFLIHNGLFFRSHKKKGGKILGWGEGDGWLCVLMHFTYQESGIWVKKNLSEHTVHD